MVLLSQYKEISFNDLLTEYQEAEASSGVSIANPDRLEQLRNDIAMNASEFFFFFYTFLKINLMLMTYLY